MDLKLIIKNQSNRANENYSYIENSTCDENKNSVSFLLQQKIINLEYQIKKLHLENEELTKTNKLLSSKIDFLVNNNTIVKNVKNEMNDCSQISHYKNQDSLKEFFFLLVICEKMKYLNYDKIWTIDSNSLFKLVLKNDLNFYEWPEFIREKVNEQVGEFYEKIEIKKKENGCFDKLK